MSLKNYNALKYVAPIGEDLQHVHDDRGVSYHSDIYLLSRLSDMKLSKQMQDIIVSRFQEVKDTMPVELQEKFDKLDDFEKMDMTDSRYTQWLSDRKERIQHFMQDSEKAVKSMEDKEAAEKLKKANESLQEFALRLAERT